MSTTASHHASSVLDSLRSSTQAVHLRLHQHPLTRNLIRPSLSIEQYVTVLYALERYHDTIETELQHIAEPAINHRATYLIRCDLLTLTGTASNPLPPCPPLSLNKSADAALGLMYVIEGSRQGGSIIARNLEKTLALDAQHGAAFFTHEAPDLHSAWDRLVDRLDRHCTDVRACCLSALTTFELLESYLWTVHGALPVTVAIQEPA